MQNTELALSDMQNNVCVFLWLKHLNWLSYHLRLSKKAFKLLYITTETVMLQIVQNVSTSLVEIEVGEGYRKEEERGVKHG